jgi:hypothetical protein
MLDHYRAMVRLSRQMLEAAHRSDWQLLIELGQQRDAVEAQLHVRPDGAQPAEADSEQEKELVAALLAANDQIQLRVETHLANLQSLAGGSDAQA